MLVSPLKATDHSGRTWGRRKSPDLPNHRDPSPARWNPLCLGTGLSLIMPTKELTLSDAPEGAGWHSIIWANQNASKTELGVGVRHPRAHVFFFAIFSHLSPYLVCEFACLLGLSSVTGIFPLSELLYSNYWSTVKHWLEIGKRYL